MSHLNATSVWLIQCKNHSLSHILKTNKIRKIALNQLNKKMKIILTVLKKEIKDTLRDRRTLFTAIVLPAIVFPLMFMGMTKIETQRMEDEAIKKLNIGLVGTNEVFGNVF